MGHLSSSNSRRVGCGPTSGARPTNEVEQIGIGTYTVNADATITWLGGACVERRTGHLHVHPEG